MRYLSLLFSIVFITLFWSMSAEATKPTQPGPSCAMVRCGFGTTCIETPGGPVCEQQSLSCANVLCAQGNQCVETSSGPQCVAAPTQPTYPSYPSYPTYPSYPSYPSHPTYPPQSCAYGGYYQYGRLICNPPPAWRSPYQYGWGHYYNPPPPPRPRPSPQPRPPWHPDGSGSMEPGPRMCTMEYDPVCAAKPVMCVKSPCPPIRKTFSNSCMAKNDGYTVLYKGQCR